MIHIYSLHKTDAVTNDFNEMCAVVSLLLFGSVPILLLLLLIQFIVGVRKVSEKVTVLRQTEYGRVTI